MAENLADIADYNDECATGLQERVQKYQRSAQAEHAKGTRRASFVFTSSRVVLELIIVQAVYDLARDAGARAHAAPCAHYHWLIGAYNCQSHVSIS
jgi:hypothetical protein